MAIRERKRANWPVVANDYITSVDPISQSGIAEKYDLLRRTVAWHCSKENWVARREEYHSATTQAMRVLEATKQAESNIDSLSIIEVQIKDMRTISLEIVKALAEKGVKNLQSKEMVEALTKLANAQEKGIRLHSFLRGGPDSRASLSFADFANADEKESKTS